MRQELLRRDINCFVSPYDQSISKDGMYFMTEYNVTSEQFKKLKCFIKVYLS